MAFCQFKVIGKGLDPLHIDTDRAHHTDSDQCQTLGM